MRDHVVGRTSSCGRAAYGNAQRSGEPFGTLMSASALSSNGSVTSHSRSLFGKTYRSARAVLRNACGKMAATALSLALALTCVPVAGVAYAADGDAAEPDAPAGAELGAPIDAADTTADESVADAPRFSEEVQLERIIASGEATRSFFLASTLRDTTVPIVQATLALAPTNSDGNENGSADPADAGPASGTAVPQVTGSFIHDGLTYAVTGEGEMALAAIDATRLSADALSDGALVLPAKASLSKSEEYALTSIMPRVFGALRITRDSEVVNAASTAERDGASGESESSEPASEEGDDADSDPDADVGADGGPTGFDSDDGTASDGSTDVAVSATAAHHVVCLGIPATVNDIAADAFANYEPLEHLVVAEGNSAYSSYDGVLYDADRTSLLLIPEGRQGAVRIAPTATNVPVEMFSHRSGLAFVVDAGSTALTSEDGFLYNIDLADFDFPVPVAITDGDSIVAATPGFEPYGRMLDIAVNAYDETGVLERLSVDQDSIVLREEELPENEINGPLENGFSEHDGGLEGREDVLNESNSATGIDETVDSEAQLSINRTEGDQPEAAALSEILRGDDSIISESANIVSSADGYVLAKVESAEYVENDVGTLQYQATISFAQASNVYVRGDIQTTDGNENAHWKLENGELSIWCDKDSEGNSYIIDGLSFAGVNDIPWASVRSLVSRALMDKDVKTNSMQYWFAYMTNLTDADAVFIPEGSTSAMGMFYYCSSLVSLAADLRLPESVEDVYIMFEGCCSLASIPVGFTAEHVTKRIRCLFKHCSSLASLPDGFRLPVSIDSSGGSSPEYEHVFYRCDSLTSFPAGFDIPSIPSGLSYTHGMLLCQAPTVTYCPSPGPNLLRYFETFGGEGAGKCNRTLYQTIPTSYSKVNFVANGEVISTQLIGENKMIIDPGDPGVTGYVFAGWYIQEDFITLYDFDRPYDEQAAILPYAGSLYALLLDESELVYGGSIPTTDGNENAHWSFDRGVLSIWCDEDEDGNSYVIAESDVLAEPIDIPWHSVRTLVTRIDMNPNLKTETMRYWFQGMSNLVDAKGSFIPEGCRDATATYKNCTSLVTLPADLVVPSSVETVYTLFEGCYALKTIPQNFSVEHVSNIRCLFKFCAALVALPERFRLPSYVEWADSIPWEHIFYRCDSLTSLPEGFDLPSIPEGRAYSAGTMYCIKETVTYCPNPGPNLLKYFEDFGGSSTGKCLRTLSQTVPSEYSVATFRYGDDVLLTQLIGPDGMITDPGDPGIAGYSFAGWYTSQDYISRFNFTLPWNSQAYTAPYGGTLYALLLEESTLVFEGDLRTTDGEWNAHWRYDDGTLNIWCDKDPDGNSYVIAESYTAETGTPWSSVRTLVTDIRMDSGVKAEKVNYWFAGMTNLVSLDAGSVFVPEGCYEAAGMFKNCSMLELLPSDFALPEGVETVYTMFEGCAALRSVPAGFTAEHVTENVRCLFKFCTSLAVLPAGFRLPASIDWAGGVSPAYDHVFNRCDSLTTFPVGFDLPSIPVGQSYSREMLQCLTLTVTYCENPGPNLVKYFEDFGGDGSGKCKRTLSRTIPTGYYKVDFIQPGEIPAADVVISSQLVGVDKIISNPGDPGISGRTFAGWFIERELRSVYDFSLPFDCQASISAFSYKLYAQLLPSYTITWSVNGGRWSEEAWDTSDKRTTAPHGGVPVQAAVPQRSGYDFVGWNLDRNASEENMVGALSDTTYYAIWKERSYTVSYIATHGGSLNASCETVIAPYESRAISLPGSSVAMRRGYTLAGWTIADESTDLLANESLPEEGAGMCGAAVTVKTLFSDGEPDGASFALNTLWRHDSYHIDYDLGVDADWVDDEGVANYMYELPEAGDDARIVIPRPAKASWVFAGWNIERTNADGTPLLDIADFGEDEDIAIVENAEFGDGYELTRTTRGHFKLTALWHPIISIDLPIEGIYNDEDPNEENEVTIYLDTITGRTGTALGVEAGRMTAFEIRSKTPVLTTLSITSQADSDGFIRSLLSGPKAQDLIDSMRFSLVVTEGVEELGSSGTAIVRNLARKNGFLSEADKLHILPSETSPTYVKGLLDLVMDTDLVRNGEVCIRQTSEKGELATLVWTVDARTWYEENAPDELGYDKQSI